MAQPLSADAVGFEKGVFFSCPKSFHVYSVSGVRLKPLTLLNNMEIL